VATAEQWTRQCATVGGSASAHTGHSTSPCARGCGSGGILPLSDSHPDSNKMFLDQQQLQLLLQQHQLLQLLLLVVGWAVV
jgi:hypothetical protein